MKQTMITSVLFVLLFLGMAIGIQFATVQQFDSNMMNTITDWREDQWTTFFQVITKAGSTVIFAVIALLFSIYFAFKRNWMDLFLIFISVLGAWGINSLLKVLFTRTRPDVVHLVEADGYSFPSSTTTISLAFYGFLVYLLLLTVQKGSWKTVILILTGIFLVFVGFSRVYLGVHFPTDILAGYFVGGFWLSVCVMIRKRMIGSFD
ncbi:phosphatase PAP2 family protein [Fervidibacillus halotolerans]|uniref:Phosphatase PAP2 family protein n=1 Tax=Fervidibacillus halotolerans TaxID=2980027 RepID=A0A9E8LZ89_9BACI|nr:phosphatase PAP2 family protein [Fervidibacillus halotolerans]WAA12142.1 phosphatase PAP2 family protein [Fervidibacillus halotolerans]